MPPIDFPDQMPEYLGLQRRFVLPNARKPLDPVLITKNGPDRPGRIAAAAEVLTDKERPVSRLNLATREEFCEGANKSVLNEPYAVLWTARQPRSDLLIIIPCD